MGRSTETEQGEAASADGKNDPSRPSGVFDAPDARLPDATPRAPSRDAGREAIMRSPRQPTLQPTRRRGPGAPPPRILVVEDEPLIHRAWTRALSEAFPQLEVASAFSLAQARTLLDVPLVAVVLDLGLPDGSGYSLLEPMRAAGDDTDVIVVTGDDDHAHMARVSALRGQLLFKPDCNTDSLLTYVSQSLARPRTDRLAASLLALERSLSAREAEALDSIIAMSPEDAALDMEITDRTVRAHLTSVASKLGVTGIKGVLRTIVARRRGMYLVPALDDQ